MRGVLRTPIAITAFILLSACSVAAAGGNSVYLPVVARDPPPTATPTVTPIPPTPTATPPIAAPPITRSGHGQQAVTGLALPAGLAVSRAVHTNGSSNFIIWLLDQAGRETNLLANEIGPADVTGGFNVRTAGTYGFNVSADGDWTITLSFPRPASAPSLPQQYSGRGKGMSPFFRLDGALHVYRLSYRGPSNFVVWLADADGREVNLLANEIGDADVSKAVGGRSGIYFFSIDDAEGDWTIRGD